MIAGQLAPTSQVIEDELVTIGSKGGVMALLRDNGSMLSIDEMVWSICGMNRFAGNVDYTVGQHTLLVHSLVPAHLKRQALMHDLAESITGDVPTPVKAALNFLYKDAFLHFEAVIMARVFRYYGLPVQLDRQVHEADVYARGIEVSYLVKNHDVRETYKRFGVVPRYVPGLSSFFEKKTREQTHGKLMELFKVEGLA